jgi:hypothetical protein
LKTETSENTIHDIEENDNGLDVLEDLCTHSRFIQRTISNSHNTSSLNRRSLSDVITNQMVALPEKSSFIQKEENEQQRTKVRIEMKNASVSKNNTAVSNIQTHEIKI